MNTTKLSALLLPVKSFTQQSGLNPSLICLKAKLKVLTSFKVMKFHSSSLYEVASRQERVMRSRPLRMAGIFMVTSSVFVNQNGGGCETTKTKSSVLQYLCCGNFESKAEY